MTLYIANQDFAVQVAGVDYEVKRGDFWDDSTALYAEAIANAVQPPLFTALPDGITTHQVVRDWEG